VPEAFFLPDGDSYVPTELTRGPWDPGSQHAGPPAALVGREVERAGILGGARVARLTLEILRPIPIAPLSVRARTLRSGRTVELVEASLADEGGDLARALAWRIAERQLHLAAGVTEEPPPGPDQAQGRPFFDTGHVVGYHTAMEVRFAAGAFTELGPATAWFRMRRPLVPGEVPSPLVRVLCAADSGNGISAALDYTRFVFVNTDLSVTLTRHPAGEWVRLDSTTLPDEGGIGMTDTALHDERGRIGRSVQTLVIAERPLAKDAVA
jgi:hypothetical protein